jgi:hypothetical protein
MAWLNGILLKQCLECQLLGENKGNNKITELRTILQKINKRVPLVLTYHPSLEKIAGIVRHHWKEIQKSETLTKLFPEPPVVAFRRPKSIKDTLVRAAVSRPSSTLSLILFSTWNVVNDINF